MIPLMEKEIIKNHGWLTTTEFIDIIAVAEVTPGPIAINSATFVGLRTAGFLGSISATVGVITPSLVILLLIIRFLTRFSSHHQVQAFMRGLRPAVLSLIALAAVLIAKEVFLNWQSFLLGSSIFAFIVWTKIHPILILLLSAFIGLLFL